MYQADDILLPSRNSASLHKVLAAKYAEEVSRNCKLVPFLLENGELVELKDNEAVKTSVGPDATIVVKIVEPKEE